MTNLRESRFHDLLPPNLRSPHTQALSHCLDHQTAALVDHISLTYILALVEALPEEMCDQVALNFNVQEYRLDMALPVKREMIQLTFQVSARKGTAWAVERLVSTIFGTAVTEEWFNYENGRPYHFRVSSEGMPETDDKLRSFWSAVYETKNLRSWLESLSFSQREEGTIFAAGTTHRRIHGEIPLEFPMGEGNVQGTLFTHGAAHQHIRHTVPIDYAPAKGNVLGHLYAAGASHQHIRRVTPLDYDTSRATPSADIYATGTAHIHIQHLIGGPENAQNDD